MSATIEDKLLQRGKQKLLFQNPDMDFHLSWFLGYAAYGGAQHGECFRVARRIHDGDPESWTTEWTAMARHIEAVALKALDTGHMISAREAYLRATTYYRAALVFLKPGEAHFLDVWEDMRSCFRMAAALFRPSILHVEIPFEGKVLPGYFARVDGYHGEDAVKRPTVIMVGGGEMFAEEHYFWAGAPALLRGYNALMVELPGQGSTPLDGLFFMVNTEAPVKAVVDYALARPEVDPERLAVFGVRGGGYIVPRAAAHEKRIKACVVGSPVLDVYRLATAELPLALMKLPLMLGGSLEILATRGDALAEILVERTCWQTGVERLSEALELARAAHLGGLINEIECPVLCLVGESEAGEQNLQAREFYNALPGPKQLRIFTEAEGAGAHCAVENLGLLHATLFDWLDDVFGENLGVGA